MKQKSESGKTSAKEHPTRRHYSADERIPHRAGRTARRGEHLRALAPKESPLRCITAAPRSSWKLANADWRATRHAPRPPARRARAACPCP